MTEYAPSNPDLRHGQGIENPLAHSNKQPAGSRPGPLAPHTHGTVKGGNSDKAPGQGAIKNKEATQAGKANPRKLH